MSQREFVTKVVGSGVDGDQEVVLVYRHGDKISVVATAEKNGDAEVILDRAAAASLAEALAEAA